MSCPRIVPVSPILHFHPRPVGIPVPTSIHLPSPIPIYVPLHSRRLLRARPPSMHVEASQHVTPARPGGPPLHPPPPPSTNRCCPKGACPSIQSALYHLSLRQLWLSFSDNCNNWMVYCSFPVAHTCLSPEKKYFPDPKGRLGKHKEFDMHSRFTHDTFNVSTIRGHSGTQCNGT